MDIITNNENLKDICGNCSFFNDHKQMVNGSYVCKYLGLTTNPNNMGCYKIQFSKINE